MNEHDRAGRDWKLREEALAGPGGVKLRRLPAHRAFWFAWDAAFPATRQVK